MYEFSAKKTCLLFGVFFVVVVFCFGLVFFKANIVLTQGDIFRLYIEYLLTVWITPDSLVLAMTARMGDVAWEF